MAGHNARADGRLGHDLRYGSQSIAIRKNSYYLPVQFSIPFARDNRAKVSD